MSITKHLTGHTHFNSPYESDSSCGTCDGALCHACDVVWSVRVTGKANLYECVHFSDRKEAVLAEVMLLATPNVCHACEVVLVNSNMGINGYCADHSSPAPRK